LPHGQLQEWDEEGKKRREGFYIEGKANGKFYIFEDGIKLYEIDYCDNQYHGKYIEWYKGETQKRYIEYKHGQKNGEDICWYENRKIQFKLKYLEGKIIFGEFYKPNGELGSKIIDGNGVWKNWDINGNLTDEFFYEDGEELISKLSKNYKY